MIAPTLVEGAVAMLLFMCLVRLLRKMRKPKVEGCTEKDRA
jgi:hypothetical protein